MAFKAGSIYGEARLDTTKWTSGLKTLTKTAGIAVAAVGAATVAALVKSIKTANEWQKAMSNINTIVDETVVNTQELAKSLIQLDPALGSTTELTQGMYQAFSAGAETAAEAMEITTQAAMFARAGLTDTFTSVDVITTAMNAYGKEVVSAEKASDLLFNTIKFGKVTGDELASSLGTSIPLYASVGISLEELTAGMASMTKVGVQANKATTQLNAIVNGFIKPSTEMTAALERQGYASGAAFLEAEGLAGALDLLQKETGGEEDALGKLIPNIRGMRGVMALSRGGAEEFTKVLNEQATAAGTTAEAFSEQEKTYATLKNSMEKIQITIGNIGKHFVDKIAVGAITAGNSVLQFLTSTQGMEVVAQVAGWVSGAFEAVRSVLSAIINEVWGPIKDFIVSLVDGFRDVAGQAETGGGLVKAFAFALNLVGAGFAIASKLAQANIGITKDLILVVIEAAKSVGNLFSILSKETTFADVRESFRNTGEAIKNLGLNFVDNMGAVVQETRDQFKDFGKDSEEIQTTITTSVIESSDKARDYILTNWDEILTGQTDFLEQYLAEIKGGNDDAGDELVGGAEETIYNLEATWQDYFDFVLSGMQSLSGSLQEISSLRAEAETQELQLEMQKRQEALDNQLAAGLITQAEYDAQKTALEEEQKARENELNKKAFESNKKFQVADVLMNTASAVMGWWRAATQLGPIAGPIFAGVMSAATGALSIVQLAAIKAQQFVPAMARGGTASGLTRINEQGGEILNLPDGTTVIPNDISRLIAADAGGPNNVINVSFAGAQISDNMDLERVANYVSRKLGKQLQECVMIEYQLKDADGVTYDLNGATSTLSFPNSVTFSGDSFGYENKTIKNSALPGSTLVGDPRLEERQITLSVEIGNSDSASFRTEANTLLSFISKTTHIVDVTNNMDIKVTPSSPSLEYDAGSLKHQGLLTVEFLALNPFWEDLTEDEVTGSIAADTITAVTVGNAGFLPAPPTITLVTTAAVNSAQLILDTSDVGIQVDDALFGTAGNLTMVIDCAEGLVTIGTLNRNQNIAEGTGFFEIPVGGDDINMLFADVAVDYTITFRKRYFV